MENASKALIIAGEVLIAIMVIAIATYMFMVGRGPAEQYGDMLDHREIARFNVTFERLVGREDITVQEIISVRNSVNASYDRTGSIAVNTNIGGALSNLSAVNARGDFVVSDEQILYWSLGSTVTNMISVRVANVSPEVFRNMRGPRFSVSESDIQRRSDGKVTGITFRRVTRAPIDS